MKNILVSVIIPNYNHAQFLVQRVTSVLNQTFQNFEVTILDDCSTDNSREVIEQYRAHPKVRHIIYNAVNTGSTFKQWQKGLQLAQGKYIWIAESDDYCDPNFLEEAINHLEKGSDFFYCKSKYVDKDGKNVSAFDSWLEDLDQQKWKRDFKLPLKEENANSLFYKNVVLNTSSAVFRADRITSDFVSKLRQFKYTGDWYLWINYFNADGYVSYSTKTNNYFRITTTSTANSSKKSAVWNKEVFVILQTVLSQLKGNRSKQQEILTYFFANYISKGSRKHPYEFLSTRLRQNFIKAKHRLF